MYVTLFSLRPGRAPWKYELPGHNYDKNNVLHVHSLENISDDRSGLLIIVKTEIINRKVRKTRRRRKRTV